MAEIERDTTASGLCKDINIVGENIGNTKKNRKALLDASKEVVLEVNPEKTKSMLKLHGQKEGQPYSINIANGSSEDAWKSKYLATLSDKNRMHEQFKSRLNSGSASYHSFQSHLSSRPLYRNLNVIIYKTMVLQFVLYW
jgi:hypothetical protein